jgi:hypothetical protein
LISAEVVENSVYSRQADRVNIDGSRLSISDGVTKQMPDENAPVELSVALETLREELEQAWQQSQGRPIRFEVPQVTINVQATARRENQMGGKLRWWLVEAGGDHTSARENVQTLVLKLRPAFYDADGKRSPLIVAGEQKEPGR